ncbi:hypothetical protein B9Z55_028245 [Caenorhabditis nigoni]|uniref:CCHC-type domain-containing protein n=1 Tax=Caenorhabditis nigoni TaxID=1611254 RepID=A0A2G5SCE7_9PELO|nr:hypothetical protein B9Z55_028245 [Caenorhabditis nigoni]
MGKTFLQKDDKIALAPAAVDELALECNEELKCKYRETCICTPGGDEANCQCSENHNPVQNYVNQVEESPILSISNRHQYDQYSENGSNNLPVERSRNNPVRIQEPVRMQRNGTGCRLCGETTHMARSCMKMTARIRRAIVRELDLCQICLNENNHSPEQCRMNNSQNRKRCNRCRVGPAHSYNICESHDEEENQVNQNEEVQEPRIEIIPEEVRMRMAPIPAEDRRAETSSEEDEESSMDEDEEESSEN